MDTKQLVLKRTLETIKEKISVDDLNDRLRLQKAIYLIQAAGADLGYRYSWYLKGPYSTALTQDYFAVAEQLKSPHIDERKLGQAFADKVIAAAKVLKKPPTITLETHFWYELIASIHFVMKEEKVKESDVFAIIQKRKAHLADFVVTGIQHLRKHKLI
jgi:hypothetical protein